MSCPACFKGSVHDGKPTGITTKLHGLDTYVVEPASGNPPKGIVVIVSDGFGWDFVNIRLMADNYAKKKDYRVYVPDFMKGHAAPLSMIDTFKKLDAKATWWDILVKPFHFLKLMYSFIAFIIPNRPGKSFPIVKGFLEELRRNEAAHLPVGVAGFCWGGKHTVLLAEGFKADGKPLIDAGFTAHPSLLKLYGDIERMRVPVSFALAETDSGLPLAQGEEIRKIVEAKPEGQQGEVKIYWGYGHGFACRVDIKNGDPKGAVEAEDQALAWFEKHFEGVEY
ncbi:dienelactone hydrolase family protein [Biscogniauxia mediterranea]|nr:dienelactone hydrolase family protein [Biscogniauxia mediterranea]